MTRPRKLDRQWMVALTTGIALGVVLGVWMFGPGPERSSVTGGVSYAATGMLLGIGALAAWFAIRAERRRSHAERRSFQATLVDSLADAVVCVSPDGVLTECNGASDRLLGYAREELLGKHATLFLSAEDARQHLLGSAAASAEAPDSRGEAVEVEIVARSGERVPVSMLVSFVHGASGPMLLVSLRDLRLERRHRRVADYLKATFEAVDEGVTIYDEQYRLVAWNKRYEELDTGIDARFLAYGAPLFDLYRDAAVRGVFGPGDPDEIAQKHIDAIRTGPLIATETLSPSTESIVRINRFRLPTGGVCATFRDVTEERRLEADLRHSQKMEAIGRLAGGVAHDLNNMLTVVLGHADLLLREADSPQQRESIRAVLEAAKRGSEVTHRMLVLSRKQALLPEPVRVGELLDSLSSLLQHTIGEKVHMRVDVDPELWECAVDRSQLESTIINLAANARDALHGQSGDLLLKASNVILEEASAAKQGVTAGDYVRLVVSDTGPGIPSEELSHVFEPFYTTKPEGEGTGLGLSMAHSFVTQSKGAITIDSGSVGTNVRILLPRFHGQGQAHTLVPRPALPRERGTDRVVLLVEDDSDVRTAITRQLRVLGFRVIAAEDGAGARSVLKSAQQVDLVLTDLVLPGTDDGRQVAAYAHTTHPGLPIVFMSGYCGEAPDITAEGAEILLAKPFGMPTLNETLQRALSPTL